MTCIMTLSVACSVVTCSECCDWHVLCVCVSVCAAVKKKSAAAAASVITDAVTVSTAGQVFTLCTLLSR